MPLLPHSLTSNLDEILCVASPMPLLNSGDFEGICNWSHWHIFAQVSFALWSHQRERLKLFRLLNQIRDVLFGWEGEGWEGLPRNITGLYISWRPRLIHSGPFKPLQCEEQLVDYDSSVYHFEIVHRWRALKGFFKSNLFHCYNKVDQRYSIKLKQPGQSVMSGTGLAVQSSSALTKSNRIYGCSLENLLLRVAGQIQRTWGFSCGAFLVIIAPWTSSAGFPAFWLVLHKSHQLLGAFASTLCWSDFSPCQSLPNPPVL